jgi:hypothetical protein
MDKAFAKVFTYPALIYRTSIDSDNRVNKTIDKLDCYELDEISSLLDFQNRQIKCTHKIYTKDYSTVAKPSAIFLAKYTESYFQTLYNIKMNRKHIRFTDIENILEGDHVVSGVPDEVVVWYAKNKKLMTWERFDYLRTIDDVTRYAINNTFDRNKPFNSHIIAPDGYYQSFILGQKTWIKNLYTKYLKCKNTAQIREILFYLMVVKHSIDTQHYFHIKSKGSKYKHILEDFKGMFDDIEEYIDELDYNFIKTREMVNRWGLVSWIDLVDDNDKLWYIKCSNEISLKHTIQAIVSYLMYNVNFIDDMFDIIENINEGRSVNQIDQVNQIYQVNQVDQVDQVNQVNQVDQVDIIINYINLLKGQEVSYTYSITPGTIKKIVGILQNNITDKIITDKERLNNAAMIVMIP